MKEGIADAGLARHVGEGAVAIVVIERVRSERRHEEIEEPIVIVIADRHAHSVRTQAYAGARGHVGEVQPRRAVGSA